MSIFGIFSLTLMAFFASFPNLEKNPPVSPIFSDIILSTLMLRKFRVNLEIMTSN